MSNPQIVLVIFVILLIGGISIFYYQDQKPVDLTVFAQCLTEKNLVMYGAEWCSHCQNQKKLFGDAFKYISYVECPDNPQKCLDAGITGFPIWISQSGEKFIGEQNIEKLAEISGCSLSIIK